MSAWHLRCAVSALKHGGVVTHPTEGVWGLACDPLNAVAVRRLLAIKGRSERQGLILIAHEFDALIPYLAAETVLSTWLPSQVLPTWPGPVTWVLPAAPWLPEWITGGRDTVAVRVTAHPVAAALCAAYGDVLVSTSANRSGKPAALTSVAVRSRLGSQVDYLLSGPLLTPGQASEIREGHSGKLLRAG